MKYSTVVTISLDKAMCDLAAALTPAAKGVYGWDCSGGIPLSSGVCAWDGVDCSGDAYVKLIDLSYRGLTGTLSTSIGGLTSLTGLALSRNKLTGLLPTSIGGLTVLASLSFGNNEFLGTVPSSFCSLQLTSLDFYNSGLACYPGCLSTVPRLFADGGVCTPPPTGNFRL